MKAKEYAKKYNEAQDKAECLFEIIKDMLLESEEIVRTRHIKRGSSLLDVFTEIEKKWLAFVKRANIKFKHNPSDPFRFVFKKLMPEIYDEWILYKMNLKSHNPSLNLTLLSWPW